MGDLIEHGAAAAPMPQTIEGLRGQNRAYRTLCASLEAQMAILTEKGREYQEAVATLDSEREENAILTDELTALRERVVELEGALRPFARELHQDTDGCDDNWPEQRTHRLGDIRCAIAILSRPQQGPSDATKRMEQALGAKFKDRDNG